MFSRGNLSGITSKTLQLPRTCAYLNGFGKFQLSGVSATWTSFTVSVNQPVRVHLDAHNCPSSSNFTCGFGQYEGGHLWVELDEEANQPLSAIRWRSKPNGQRVAGQFHNTYHRFVQFYPKLFHATDRWTGFRVSLTFYTSRLISQATATRKECLRKYGFPLPGSTPASSRSDHGEAHFAPDVGDLEGETSVFLTQEARERLHDSCQEVWSEVDNLLSLHGRDAFPVQVIEFGGPAESHLCLLLEHQGGKGFSASLSQGYDLGTRGGCHRSLQQVQVAQLQPQLAWFQLPKGPVFSRERAQDPKFKAQLHKRRKVSRNVIAISQAQLRHGDCV